MFYLVQNSKEERFPYLIEAMEKLGIEYEICKYRPFIHEIEFKTERKDIFCFAAYEMTGLSEKYGFNPGQISTVNHNFELYSQKYGYHNMLNGDCKIIEFTDDLPNNDDWNEFFARPTIDQKIFKGQVFLRDEWNNYVQNCKDNNTVNYITDVCKIVISSPKNIEQEIRCWVVGGRVVTLSQYKLGYTVTSKNLDDDFEAKDFAQKMVDKYQPSEAFVMDICRTKNGFKIVELNCINSSGFYHMDCEKLLLALEKEFSNEK